MGGEACELTTNRDFLVCEVACDVAEKLLPGVEFSYYSHPDLTQLYVQSHTRYYVPRYVFSLLGAIQKLHLLVCPVQRQCWNLLYSGITTN